MAINFMFPSTKDEFSWIASRTANPLFVKGSTDAATKYEFYADNHNQHDKVSPSWLNPDDTIRVVPIPAMIRTNYTGSTAYPVDQTVFKQTFSSSWLNVINDSVQPLTVQIAYENTPNISGTTFIGKGTGYSGQFVILLNDSYRGIAATVDAPNTGDLSLGTWGGWVVMHEMGHILGLPHSSEPAPQNNDMRFTIMDYPVSYLAAKIPLTPGMDDINKFTNKSTTNNGSESQYIFTKESVKLGVADTITVKNIGDHVMTIWDGGGEKDTLDASRMGDVSVYLDLREGYFSAIGTGLSASDFANADTQMQTDTRYNVGIAVGAQIENAKGGSGNDYLKGNDLANTLEGNGGADTLEGGAGNDILKGGTDIDTLKAGIGDDTLDGGTGNDILEGGDGFDTYIINTGDGHDHIVDTGRNRIIFNGKSVNGVFIKNATGQYVFIGDDGRKLEFHSPGVLTLDASTSITFDSYTNAETFNNDRAFGINLVDNTPTTPTSVRNIIGDFKPQDFDLTSEGIQGQLDDLRNVIVTAEVEANREDTLYDGAGNDHMQGMGGDDRIYLTRGGDDWVQGGAGDDIVTSNLATGKALIEGNAGADQLFGGTQDDTIYGGDKLDLNEAISQGATQTASTSKGDWLDGASGDDILVGTASADGLVGGGDILFGIAANDAVYENDFERKAA